MNKTHYLYQKQNLIFYIHQCFDGAPYCDLWFTFSIFVVFTTGSADERRVVEKVNNFSHKRDHMRHVYDFDEKDDVVFTFTGKMDGKGDVNVKLNMHNATQETQNVVVRMYANATYYIGLTGEELDSLHKSVSVDAGKGSYI